jgi:hypothetical protein
MLQVAIFVHLPLSLAIATFIQGIPMHFEF